MPEVVKYLNETGEYNYSLDDTDNEDSYQLSDMRKKLTELMEYVGETQPDIFSLEWKVDFLCALRSWTGLHYEFSVYPHDTTSHFGCIY